ncbi:unnamed protein product, partial [Iphiclides podalirius]
MCNLPMRRAGNKWGGKSPVVRCTISGSVFRVTRNWVCTCAMAECSFARCQQERRAIRKELQRWTKNMVYILVPRISLPPSRQNSPKPDGVDRDVGSMARAEVSALL